MKVVVEEEVSSSTDPVEGPAKEQPMATPSVAQGGVMKANLSLRREFVLIQPFPILAALSLIETLMNI